MHVHSASERSVVYAFLMLGILPSHRFTTLFQTVSEIFGVGPILAAKLVGIVGDVARFPSKVHFASYVGVAPIEASSGEVVRHRVSLAGNRRLNKVMHMVALCQARSHPRG
jgi:transposase